MNNDEKRYAFIDDDGKLTTDIKIGAGTFKKGVKASTAAIGAWRMYLHLTGQDPDAQLPDRGELEEARKIVEEKYNGMATSTLDQAVLTLGHIKTIRSALSTLPQQPKCAKCNDDGYIHHGHSVIAGEIQESSELCDCDAAKNLMQHHPNTGADSKLIEKMQFVIGNPGFKNMPVKELLSQAISALQQREGIVISRECAALAKQCLEVRLDQCANSIWIKGAAEAVDEIKAAIGESSPLPESPE